MSNDKNASMLCMGCMSLLENTAVPCPVCGYEHTTSASSPHQLTPNTILCGKYLVGRVLGEGGFGITYLGYDLNLDIKIAIKEYYPSGLVTRETTSVGTSSVTPFTGEKSEFYKAGLEKFVNEAKSLAKFYTLPGIVAVKDFFRENETAYIVMEFVDGTTLKNYVAQQGGKLPVIEVLDLMRPLMDSLTHIHGAGIIHRDISPDNIMIARSGVKLIDFGAARDYGVDSNQSRTVLLKPGFAPEEQYRTRGEQGPWTDVYALCATIYKCITGETPPEALERIRQDDLIPPSKFGAQLSESQETALLKGMAVFRQNRFQSIAQLCQGLYSTSPPAETVPAGSKAGIDQTVSSEDTTPDSPVHPRYEAFKYKKILIAGAALIAGIIFACIILNQKADRNALAVNTPRATISITSSPVPTMTTTPQPVLTARPEATLQVSAEPSRQELAQFNRFTIACGNEHTLVLEPSGTITGLGNNAHNQCTLVGWTDVVQMAGGFAHSIGLRRDGTVVATSLPKGDENEYGQCNVSSWKDIVQIDSGWVHSVGLKADGTVVAAGYNEYGQCDVGAWSGIAEVAAGGWNTVARTKDGRVLSIGNNQYGQNNTPWDDITQIAVGRQFVVGLRADGTVVAAGRNKEKQCEVSGWTDIIALAAGDYHTVGLKADGTVVSTAMPSSSENNYGQGSVSGWTDICALFAGARGSVGLKKDGSLVYAGIDIFGLNEVGNHSSIVFYPQTGNPVKQ